jgi:magnesium-transporting ATPase (P-type)
MKSAPIYSLRLQEVYSTLETSPSGLAPEEAEARLSLYGGNVLSSPPRESSWRKLAVQVTHPMALLLWVAGFVAWGVGDPVLGVIIWIVVLVNGVFSFWQEYRAGQATAFLEKLLPNYARVMRGGAEGKIPATTIVPGDLLVLAEGDHIPADARVIEEYGLRVNNSTLTGEAVPARKTADASLRRISADVERPNLVLPGQLWYPAMESAGLCYWHADPVWRDHPPDPGYPGRAQPHSKELLRSPA